MTLDFLIDKYGKLDNRKIYEKVNSFGDLLKTGMAFLDGRITHSFNHVSQPDEETLVLLDDMKILHEKGVLTLDSQPQESLFGYSIEYGVDKGLLADIEQKEYVQCIVRNSDVGKIIRCLSSGGYLYDMVNLNDGSRTSNWCENDYVLSRDRTYYDKNPVWEDHSFASRINVDDYFTGLDKFPNICDIIRRECTGILVHVKTFGPNGGMIKHMKNSL